MRFRTSIVAILILALCAVPLPGCGPKTKPALTKFDAGALTAVQTLASVEKTLSAAGKLTPAQSLDIRKKLDPVITLGQKATDALIAWQPGNPAPDALLRLSAAIGELTTEVITLLPAGAPKAELLAAVAVAQQAWSAAIVLMNTGKAPEPDALPALLGESPWPSWALATEGGAA